MRRRYLRLAIVITVVSLLAFAGLIAARSFRNPPIVTLNQAYQAVSKAQRSPARSTHKSLVHQAESFLSLGERAIEEENDEWLPFWSYKLADSLLQCAIATAQDAMRKSEAQRQDELQQARAEVAVLGDSLQTWRRRLDNDLQRTDFESIWRSARSHWETANSLAAKGLDSAAGYYVDRVRTSLKLLSDKQRNYAAGVSHRTNHGQEWVAQTRRLSRSSQEPVIVVDKSAHSLYVLQGGKIRHTYPCDLGYNAAYQKYRSGDGATPEGMYRVKEVKYRSKYYRALVLNYPNEQDRVRFRENLRNGTLASNARIGGLIEIHGHGGQGRDWTDGCVAVADDHMDALLKMVSEGTPVTIVRSWER